DCCRYSTAHKKSKTKGTGISRVFRNSDSSRGGSVRRWVRAGTFRPKFGSGTKSGEPRERADADRAGRLPLAGRRLPPTPAR
ncbi:hypothetical protein AVEN_16881-1, partial [Araneus ventricosus]